MIIQIIVLPASFRSAESMGRTSGAVGAPPASHSDAKKPSLETYDKKELIMMPPEEKLKHFESRAQALEDNQEVSKISYSNQNDTHPS